MSNSMWKLSQGFEWFILYLTACSSRDLKVELAPTCYNLYHPSGAAGWCPCIFVFYFIPTPWPFVENFMGLLLSRTLLFGGKVLAHTPFLRDSNLDRVWHIGESVEILLAFWLLPPTAYLCKALRYQYVHFNSIGVSWVVSLYFLFENILGLRAILN